MVYKGYEELKTNLRGETKAAEGPVVVLNPDKPMRYVSLHHHSTFSYLDGFAMPSAHIRRAQELNMGALALTEHGNVSSHVKLEEAATAVGIKPIFGCEIYTGSVSEESKTQRKNHLTVLAENQEGYRNLLRLVSQGWSDFYYEPTVSGPTLLRFRKGLIILSGCTGSLLATSLIGGKNISEEDASYERGRRVAKSFRKHFGDSYYLEVQAFPELPNVVRLNKMLVQLSEELGIPLAATGDCHYTRPDENEMQQILHNVRGGGRKTLEEQAREWGYDVPLSPPLSDQVMYERLRASGLPKNKAIEAIVNTEEIAQRCNVELPKVERLRFPVPAPFKSSHDVWRAWIREGWAYRGCDSLPPAEQKRYKDQLLYEINIIEKKDFIDYFLIVADIVKFAKDAQIAVGPARGSAAASIVCWLLRITEVNPMEFPGLVFERFIDLTREDLPDIDLDFDSERRGEIRDYAVSKYGSECVGNIGTFTFYKSKLALDDVARVYRVPKWSTEILKGLILERSSGDLRATDTIEDTIDQFEEAQKVVVDHPDLMRAIDLEGNVKGMGVHAAGLIISNGPLTDVCSVYEKKIKEETVQVISLDKYDSERQGLIKIDILGLSTMTMISECMRLLNMTTEDLYAIPLDDPEVIKGFQENDTVGIFQFDGRAMRHVNSELKPDSFKEVCDANALARPGPLHSGASAQYFDLKWGRKQPEKIHPIYDEIAGQTRFQIVYQEQILRIVREMGKFDWTHAAYIRKIISKKLGEQEFNRQWEKFLNGAIENGVSEETAKRVWNMCITAGSYAFNAAHCVSYGMLAWWTMWFKRHHPLEFYAASLAKMPEKKHVEYLRDATRKGIEIKPPDPLQSTDDWIIHDGALLAGLSQVPGIGDKTAKLIIEYRGTLGDRELTWGDLTAIKGIGPKTIVKIKEFAEKEDPFEIFRIKDMIDKAKDFIRQTPGLPYPTHCSEQIPYRKGADTEIVWAGLITRRNLRDLFESHFSRTGQELDPSTVKAPHLRQWVVGDGVDDDGVVTINWDRFRYSQFEKAVWGLRENESVVLIRGIKPGYQARRVIKVSEMWVINVDE